MSTATVRSTYKTNQRGIRANMYDRAENNKFVVSFAICCSYERGTFETAEAVYKDCSFMLCQLLDVRRSK